MAGDNGSAADEMGRAGLFSRNRDGKCGIFVEQYGQFGLIFSTDVIQRLHDIGVFFVFSVSQDADHFEWQILFIGEFSTEANEFMTARLIGDTDQNMWCGFQEIILLSAILLCHIFMPEPWRNCVRIVNLAIKCEMCYTNEKL